MRQKRHPRKAPLHRPKQKNVYMCVLLSWTLASFWQFLAHKSVANECNNNFSIKAIVLKCVDSKMCTAGTACCQCKLRLQEIPAALRDKGGSAGLPGKGWHFVKVTWAWMLHLLQPEVAAGPSWILTIVHVLVQSGQPVFVGTNHWFCHCE